MGACPNFSTSTAPLPAALIGLRCLVGELTRHLKAVSVSLFQVSHLSGLYLLGEVCDTPTWVGFTFWEKSVILLNFTFPLMKQNRSSSRSIFLPYFHNTQHIHTEFSFRVLSAYYLFSYKVALWFLFCFSPVQNLGTCKKWRWGCLIGQNGGIPGHQAIKPLT